MTSEHDRLNTFNIGTMLGRMDAALEGQALRKSMAYT
jgi:Ser/Thr protein kinase RdoA (MazF antagonist)